MDFQKNVVVEVYSITGALVATFYNNTENADDLIVECKQKRDGGLDSFSFTVPYDSVEPLFNDMECRIYADGVWWFTGYAEIIPAPDSDRPIIEIKGLGYFKKLKEKTINRSYAAQTLDFIIKDIASNELGSEINVYYNVAKISVPVIVGITIQFIDKTLSEVFKSLNKIANKDYLTTQYTFGVDKEKELYYSPISNDSQIHYFEGYDYQSPKVDNVFSKMVNKILAYRTKEAASQEVEYVATYQDSTSIGLYGEFSKKLTFPDYADSATIANISNSIIEKYREPLERVKLKDLEVPDVLLNGFYTLSNRRDRYFLPVNDFEDLSEWDLSNMITTIPTIDDTNVFTGRKSLKLVTAVGSAGDYMEYTLPEVIKFPDLFRMFVFLEDINGSITITITDTNNNDIDLDFGDTGNLTGAWIKRVAPISLILLTDNLVVDPGTGEDDLIVDFSPSVSDVMTVDIFSGGGVSDVAKVRITINNDNASTIFIDSMATRANTFKTRKLILEQAKYTLSKSFLCDAVFGEKLESLIDEISAKVDDGNIALSVFSKQ